MAKAQATEKQAAMKAAQKKLGVKPPKHESNPPPTGDCAEVKPVVESGFSIFNQSTRSPDMTEDTKPQAEQVTANSNFPEKRASPAQLEKEAAAKKAIADKAAKKKAREDAILAAAKARADAKAERESKVAANAQAREARAAELAASGRTYTGSMVQLAERVKQGAYVKSMTGQLRSTDELAVALDAVPPTNVVLLGLKALALDSNPYVHLNVGQQSMNLRNRMRGAIKAGKLTLAQVTSIRDENGFATAEAEIAKRKEAQAARVAKQAADKAAKEVQAQKAAQKAAPVPAPAAEAPKPVVKPKAKPPVVQTGATA